jgi:hypothetical protein
LYLALAGGTTPEQGVRIFNIATDAELTADIINAGLPPRYVLFVE